MNRRKNRSGKLWLWMLLPPGMAIIPGLWLLQWGSQPSTRSAAPKRPPEAERPPTVKGFDDAPIEAKPHVLATTAQNTAEPPPARSDSAPYEGGGILRGDPMVGYMGAPVEQERTGWHGRLFAVWATEGEDRWATQNAADLLDELLAEHDIRPVAHFVGCGPSLCRARLRFHTLKELHRMNKITPPDGIEISSTFPARMGDDLVDVSVYWPGDGLSLQEAASAQEFFETGDPWSGF